MRDGERHHDAKPGTWTTMLANKYNLVGSNYIDFLACARLSIDKLGLNGGLANKDIIIK